MKINTNHGVVMPILVLGEIWFCMFVYHAQEVQTLIQN
jgi:hypothetical protein